MALNPRMQAFVHEYAKTGNGTQAAIAAGYGKAGAMVQASRLLDRADVRSELAALQEHSRKKARRTLDELDRVAERLAFSKKVEPKDRLKALDLLYKRRGAYPPTKHEHSGSVAIQFVDPFRGEVVKGTALELAERAGHG